MLPDWPMRRSCAARASPPPHGLASALRVPDRARGLPWYVGQRRQRNPLAVISRTSRSAFSRLPKAAELHREAAARAHAGAALDSAGWCLRRWRPPALELAGSATGGFSGSAARRDGGSPAVVRLWRSRCRRSPGCARIVRQPEAARRGLRGGALSLRATEPTHRGRWYSGAYPRRSPRLGRIRHARTGE